MVFGDVKENSSRAFFDYMEDSEEEDYDGPSIVMKLDDDKITSKINHLLICFGALSNDFASQNVLSCKHALQGRVVAECDGETTPLAQLWGDKANADTMVCQCRDLRRPEFANDVVSQLFLLAAPGCVITVLATEHASKLLHRQGPALYHLKTEAALKCDQKSSFSASSPLPQPYIVDNIPASVISLATVRRMNASVYVAFAETLTDASYVSDGVFCQVMPKRYVVSRSQAKHQPNAVAADSIYM